ncbi:MULTISPECIES: hybrid sensor histidine kinase/response regulator [Cyanophyceae]|uniref:hybrid sensor histidine kinase/response regulator n=1 Tax=Cyanophyceae TaxID=3028117 RepID=UPI0016895494|nr:ATP-binding protein [Trichocoleus sp. FACHB-69]MBD1933431.1 PAS domain S-box protein [Trichocoleus sp. FACHB-69]
MKLELRVLIVEDSEEDAELLIYELKSGDYHPIYERVDTADGFIAALDKQHWDIVIADYSMPCFSAPAALSLLQENKLDIPFIIVSGTIGEEMAVDAMKAGASDYVMKGNLARLIPAVERELREALQRQKRREAEQALREKEERFRSLIENALDIITVVSPDGNVYYISPSVHRVLGYESEELLEKNLFFYIHPEDVTEVIDNLHQALNKPSSTLFTKFRFQHQDGSWRVLEGVCKKIIYSPELASIVVNCRDITERQQAEEICRELEKQKELNESKFNFVSIMSHEFRNPLNIITISAELLENYSDVASKEQKYLYFQRIRAAARNMTQLLDDILTISKAEVGKLEIKPATLDLAKFCLELVEEMQFSNAGNAVNFVFKGGEVDGQQSQESEAGTITNCCSLAYMDEKLLRHIFINLLSNAIKYSPAGGEVLFELSCQNYEAIIQVKDQGIGIPANDQKRLFEVFHRAGNVGKIPGTGLGLSIVKKFVELHGGKIEVSSEVGVGSTFTVKLPLQSQRLTESRHTYSCGAN